MWAIKHIPGRCHETVAIALFKLGEVDKFDFEGIKPARLEGQTDGPNGT